MTETEQKSSYIQLINDLANLVRAANIVRDGGMDYADIRFANMKLDVLGSFHSKIGPIGLIWPFYITVSQIGHLVILAIPSTQNILQLFYQKSFGAYKLSVINYYDLETAGMRTLLEIIQSLSKTLYDLKSDDRIDLRVTNKLIADTISIIEKVRSELKIPYE